MEDLLRWSDFERFAYTGVPNSFPDWIGEQLLDEIVNELEWFGTFDFDPRVHSGERRARVMYYQGVLFQPTQWFGAMDVSHRQRYSRACLRLERDGYVVRETESFRNRAIALRPTLYGLTWPLRDASFERKRAVVEGLRRTRWGQELAEELIKEMASGQ